MRVSCGADPLVVFSELLNTQLDTELGMPIPRPTMDEGVTLVNVTLIVPPCEIENLCVLEPPLARKLANVSVAAAAVEDVDVKF